MRREAPSFFSQEAHSADMYKPSPGREDLASVKSRGGPISGPPVTPIPRILLGEYKEGSLSLTSYKHPPLRSGVRRKKKGRERLSAHTSSRGGRHMYTHHTSGLRVIVCIVRDSN